MEFICGYMDDEEYRPLLSELTGEIFGFSFESWYSSGFFEGEYIPYSYLENGKIIANTSANIMRFAYNGEEKFYIQIGTVMTRPEYRKQGLARSLIEKILTDYKAVADGFYLFANLNALRFYEKIGFQRQDQWRYIIVGSGCGISLIDDFLPVGKEHRDAYVQMLKSAKLNAAFDHINRCSLQMFYTMEMENVYFNSLLNCYAIMHAEGDVLHLDSIISSNELDLKNMIQDKGAYSKIVLGFTPKERESFEAECYNGEDEYRFYYIGSDLECISKDKLYLPVMSHA